MENTNTNPNNNISIINAGKLKKKSCIISLLRILTRMNPKHANPRFYTVKSKITADIKPRLNQNYIVKL